MNKWEILNTEPILDIYNISRAYDEVKYAIKEKKSEVTLDELNQAYDQAIKETFSHLLVDGKLPENMWLKREDEVLIEYFEKSNEDLFKKDNKKIIPFTLRVLAYQYMKEKEYDIALEYIDKAISFDTNEDMSEFYTDKANILIEKEMYKDALIMCDKRLEIDKEDYWANYFKAIASYEFANSREFDYIKDTMSYEEYLDQALGIFFDIYMEKLNLYIYSYIFWLLYDLQAEDHVTYITKALEYVGIQFDYCNYYRAICDYDISSEEYEKKLIKVVNNIENGTAKIWEEDKITVFEKIANHKEWRKEYEESYKYCCKGLTLCKKGYRSLEIIEIFISCLKHIPFDEKVKEDIKTVVQCIDKDDKWVIKGIKDMYKDNSDKEEYQFLIKELAKKDIII